MTVTTRRNLFLLTVGVAIAVWIIAANQPGTYATTSPLATAVETCNLAGNTDLTVGDAGRTLTIDGANDAGMGLDIGDTACVVAELGITDAAVTRIDQTRALDGMQDATWGDYQASWTYHPDDGLDLLITWGDA